MVGFLFGGIIFYFGMMLASFIGGSTVMCLFAGVGMMRKLENAGLLIRTNYKRYVIPVFFWILIFMAVTLLIVFKTDYLIVWLIGSGYGFFLAFKKSLSRENLISGIKEVCRDNKDIIIRNDEYWDMLYQILR